MKRDNRIVKVSAQEVFTFRGYPGIEALVVTENGSLGKAVATSGLSMGQYEAKFLLDGGTRWNGLGVKKAVNNVNKIISPALIGMDSTKQLEIDNILLALDGTEDKSNLGANTLGSVSAAVLKAGAASLGIPLYQHIGGTTATTLPVPGALVMLGSRRYGGGEYAGGKPSYSVMAYGFENFHEASYAAWETSNKFERSIVQKMNLTTSPGGFTNFIIPRGVIKDDREFLEVLTSAICDLGYDNKVGIQLDVAAGTYYDRKKQKYIGLFSEGEKDKYELIEVYKKLTEDYPFIILEDPLEEDDFDGHSYLKKELEVEIVGDDLFTTNLERVKIGIEKDAADSVLLKVYQIGSISQAFEMVQFAKNHGMNFQPCSSRGEGADIADYSVGLNAGYIREGATGPEGNRLLEIENELGSRAIFLGKEAFKRLK